MKTKNIIISILLGAFMLWGTGCTDKLDEHPFTVFSVEYFKTPEGIQNAVNALYSGLRYDFGPEGAVAINVDGTDEWTYAEQPRSGASGTADFLTLGNYTLDFANGAILTPWNRNYSNINLANAVCLYAPQVPITDAKRNVLLGEARYLRAQYYILLVQQFGAVPVDLGSGDLQFNQNPFQGFNRLPVADVLVKDYNAIIDDLTFASQNLPDQRPSGAFKLSKAAAFHLLAQAYMYRAYSSVKQSTDFQNAYNAATEVINNKAKYGVDLQPTYALVHKRGNEYNSEILFSIERIPGNSNANEVPDPTNTIGGGKGIDAANDFCPDYTNVKAPLASSPDAPCADRSKLYGRPIRRFCPTPWLYNVAFRDKDNDSRYDGSFRTVWLATKAVGSYAIGDTAFILTKTDRVADSINNLTVKKKYRVIGPKEFYLIGGSISQNIYPYLNKYEDSLKNVPNDETGRPFVVSKFSDCYLLAAEAAMQLGNNQGAADLINVLKQRAANRTNLSATDIRDIKRRSPLGEAAVSGTSLSANEVDRRYNNIKVSASDINLDFILDERTRELCGESIRWPDLAVRGKLIERVKLDNPDAANIKDYHVLRPIPKGQLDAVADPDKTQYQNPGY